MDEGTTPSFITLNTTHFLHMNTFNLTNEQVQMVISILEFVNMDGDFEENSGYSQELLDETYKNFASLS